MSYLTACSKWPVLIIREKYREGLVKALSATQTVPLLSPTAMTFAAGTVPYGAPAKATNPSAAPSSSQMSTLTELLSSGNKREAAEYAARQGLWSHALILASSVGPDLWRDTVKSFADAELSGEGFGGMKAAYLLFAGGGAQVGGASQVDELFSTANITDDPAKDQWKDVIGSIVLNGQAADAVHLDDLGARFAKKGLHNAAAVWYVQSCHFTFAVTTDMTAICSLQHLPLRIPLQMRSTSLSRFWAIRRTRTRSSLLKWQSMPEACCPFQRARRCRLLVCLDCCPTSCRGLGWRQSLARQNWLSGESHFKRCRSHC